MEDQFAKFLRLFGNIFFAFLGFVVALMLLMFGLRLLLSGLDYIPWFTYFYMSLMLLIPPALFVSVFTIFFNRTKKHPSKAIRIFSSLLFIVAIICWIIALSLDFVAFFKDASPEISHYYSYNLLFLVSNAGLIFFTGILQALTTEKEKDWMEKHQNP
jgi:hypothetical protein